MYENLFIYLFFDEILYLLLYYSVVHTGLSGRFCRVGKGQGIMSRDDAADSLTVSRTSIRVSARL